MQPVADQEKCQKRSIYAYPFFLPYSVPFMTVLAQQSSKHWHALIPPFFVWVLIPVFDIIAGSTCKAPQICLSRTERKQLEARLSFRIAIYLWCPLQLSVLVWAAGLLNDSNNSEFNLKQFGLLWSVVLISAEGINCSHELLHRRSPFERFLGKLLLMSVCYGHFCIEHARGHHFKVATPQDPATMRFGESFYKFLPRTVLGGYTSAWTIETNRLVGQNLPIFSPHNEMIVFALGQICFALFFHHFFGVRGLMLFMFQSAFSILLLEQINAIEHYGLLRKKVSSGSYERIGPRHSWDAPQTVSNFLLFKLQVHADHHLHVTKRYQALEIKEDSPKLPAGYLSLAPLLLVPPLWRAVMDPILVSYWEEWEKEGAMKRVESNAGKQQ